MSEPQKNLDHSLVQGIAWIGGVRWVTQVISWAVTLVVARLLTPGDYGVFGMAMVYVGLAQIVGESGPTAAVIQRRELGENELAQLGGLAVLTGLGLTVVTFALSWPMAWFYRTPGVQPIVAVLALTFIVRSLGVLPRGLMARDLKFRQLAWLDGAEAMALITLTLAGALLGLGPWALVGGTVGSGVVFSLTAVLGRRHRIALPARGKQLDGAFRFALHVVASQLATYAFSNADFAIVGRRLGSVALGTYTLAWTIASIPVERISGLVGRVTPAYFSAVQHDVPELRRYLRSITEALALVTLPACIGLALVANRLVPVAVGPQWTAAVLPLQLLAAYAAFRSITLLTQQVLFVTDRARRMMQFSLAAVAILPIVFYVGATWGTPGVAIGWLIAYPMIAVAGFVRPALRAVDLPWRDYVATLLPACGGTLVMAAAVWVEQSVAPARWPTAVHLAADVLTGAATYALVLLIVHRRRVLALVTLAGESFGLSLTRAAAPWFESEGPARDVRLLLISYHFPPDAAVGGLRWQKLARFVAERGWGLDVIALDPGNLLSRDDARLADLPAGVRIFGVEERRSLIERLVTRAWQAATALGAAGRSALRQRQAATPSATPASRARGELRWRPREFRDVIRAYAAAVDHARGQLWIQSAVRVAHQLLEPGVHRAIVTCGPPHHVHVAGRQLAGETGLPWVMDLRDPWSLVQRVPEGIASSLWFWLAARHERTAVADATMIVANTEALANAMRRAYPAAADRVIAVTNGHDDDQIPDTTPNGRFTIAYAGSIYLDRDPRPLFRAAARLVAARGLTPATFGLEFMGVVDRYDGHSLKAIAGEEGVDAFLSVHAPRPRQDALRFLAGASVLTIMPQDSDMAIPAKAFDYMQFDAWILAFAEPGSAVDLLLRGSGADVVRPRDVAETTAALVRRYDQFTRGERATRLAFLDRFSRRVQAGILLDAIAAGANLPEASRAEASETREPVPVCAA